MAIMGRVVTRQEAEKLVYYFDQNGNQTVEFDEFKRGVERLVGTGCPHGSGT
jgi:Ca2+-binding EF-hand superfamily protein